MSNDYFNEYGELVLSEDDPKSEISEEWLIENINDVVSETPNLLEFDFIAAMMTEQYWLEQATTINGFKNLALFYRGKMPLFKIMKIENELYRLYSRVNGMFFGKRGRCGKTATWNRGIDKILKKNEIEVFYSERFGLVMRHWKNSLSKLIK